MPLQWIAEWPVPWTAAIAPTSRHLAKVRPQDLATQTYLQKARPVSHQGSALIKVPCVVVGRADTVSLNVSELQFDVLMGKALLVENS